MQASTPHGAGRAGAGRRRWRHSGHGDLPLAPHTEQVSANSTRRRLRTGYDSHPAPSPGDLTGGRAAVYDPGVASGEAGMAARSDEPSAVTRRQGLVVVLALTVIAALIIINLAFSTANTAASVDGRSATTSEFVGGQ
ncbi:MAG: hypothetical protein M3P53_07140 [Actinomycetota bacterium]|nr:hypothetical protein [Actinomycetota bacterium]